MIEPHGAVAKRFHFAHGMRHEQNGNAARTKFVHLAETSLAKIDVPHSEGLIDE